MSQHIVTPKTYLIVFVLLILLTILTVAVSFLNLGDWHTPVGLSIATLKATLVVLFFMHLMYSSRVTWIVAGVALFWLGILHVLTLTDYWTRHWLTF